MTPFLEKRVVEIQRYCFVDDLRNGDSILQADGVTILKFETNDYLSVFANPTDFSVRVIKGKKALGESYELVSTKGSILELPQGKKLISIKSYRKKQYKEKNDNLIELVFENGNRLIFEYYDDESQFDCCRVIKTLPNEVEPN